MSQPIAVAHPKVSPCWPGDYVSFEAFIFQGRLQGRGWPSVVCSVKLWGLLYITPAWGLKWWFLFQPLVVQILRGTQPSRTQNVDLIWSVNCYRMQAAIPFVQIRTCWFWMKQVMWVRRKDCCKRKYLHLLLWGVFFKKHQIHLRRSPFFEKNRHHCQRVLSDLKDAR